MKIGDKVRIVQCSLWDCACNRTDSFFYTNYVGKLAEVTST